jgi:hypothetical protein
MANTVGFDGSIIFSAYTMGALLFVVTINTGSAM